MALCIQGMHACSAGQDCGFTLGELVLQGAIVTRGAFAYKAPSTATLNAIFTATITNPNAISRSSRLHLTLDEHHRRYGPIVHIKLGGVDTVFISDADAIRSVYLHEGKYPKHIIPPAFTYFNNKHKLARGLLFM